jgi:hypothetical protein
MSELFDTIVQNFCLKMGFIAVWQYDRSGINLWAHKRGVQVAKVAPRFPHILVYGTVYDDGGIRFDLKGKFDVYDPGSFQDLRQCLLEKVKIKGYELPAETNERKVGSRKGFFDR